MDGEKYEKIASNIAVFQWVKRNNFDKKRVAHHLQSIGSGEAKAATGTSEIGEYHPMLTLRSPNRPDEDLYSVDAIEHFEGFREINVRRLAMSHHGLAVEIAGKVFVRADKLAVVIGRDVESVTALCARADDDLDVADGPIYPAAESERQALVTERRLRADADYARAAR